MPPARQNEHLIFNDPNEASDILCRDLGLQDKPQVYDAVRAWIHRLIDQHLDLRLASYNQSKNMKRLVDQVVRDFPGYFKKHSRWRDRVHSLQAYATSYLDARQTELNGTTELSSPLWDPPKRADNIVKVKWPQSRPSKRSRTRVEQLLPALPIDSDSDMSERIQSPPPSEEEEDVEVNEHHHTPVPSKRVSYVVTSVSPSPQPSPAPQPEPSFFPEPSPGPEPSPAPEASPEPEPSPEPPGPIERFVADCYPAMRHLAAPLHRAGVVEEAHLLGMARWADETLREFLRKNDVVRTPLEEEVLIIGFSTILSDHIHAH